MNLGMEHSLATGRLGELARRTATIPVVGTFGLVEIWLLTGPLSFPLFSVLFEAGGALLQGQRMRRPPNQHMAIKHTPRRSHARGTKERVPKGNRRPEAGELMHEADRGYVLDVRPDRAGNPHAQPIEPTQLITRHASQPTRPPMAMPMQ
jgi:hypothetical protein